MKKLIHLTDVIICSDVLEHLENPASLIRQMQDLITEDGEIIITIPNAFNIYQKLLILFTDNTDRYRVENIGEYGHISIFTTNTLKSILKRAKLQYVDIGGGAAFFGGLIWFPKNTFGTLLSYNLIFRIKRIPA